VDPSVVEPFSSLITATVENSRDQDVSLVPIVNDIALDDERTNTLAELGPAATHARLFDVKLESVEDSVDEPIGRRRAGILGDVRPDLLEVSSGKDGQSIRHLPLLGAICATARLDPLGEPSTGGRVVRTSLASSDLIKARVHVGAKLFSRLIAFVQEPECLTDHFAGGLV
jgi:hypothetical protein